MSILERFSLKGRRALVTGSSRGLGNALAWGLADAGAELVLNARNPLRLEEAVRAATEAGHAAHALPFDAADPRDVYRAVERFEAETGPIDILVGNAGVQFPRALEDFSPDKFDELMRRNVHSVFYVGQAVARFMIERGRGRIVNLCSVNAALAQPTIAAYAASTGAVASLTRGMAADWGRHGITVNGLAPGYFRTGAEEEDPEFSRWLQARTPMGRSGEIEELIGAAVFLASDAASFVNGHILNVDGAISATL